MNIETHYPHLLARLVDTPLMIHPGKLDAILCGLREPLGLSEVELNPHAYLPGQANPEQGTYRVKSGVAVIEMFGALAHRTTMKMPSTMIQGYERLAATLDTALNDASVRSILLEVDSPGGEVAGAFQLAEMIYQARGRKPIHAVASDIAASAAYLIASAAETFSVTETGQVGSIGVVMRHMDVSQAMEKQGVKMTYIHAGERKVEGNPHQPLSEATQARLQSSVDSYYQMFIDAVVKYRPQLTETQVRATQAGMLSATEALQSGFVDSIHTPVAVFQQLVTRGKLMNDLEQKVESLTALNTDLKQQMNGLLNDHDAATRAMKDALAIETERANQAQAEVVRLQQELAAVQIHQRQEQVKTLFEDLGRECTAESAQPYLAMSPETFAVVAQDLRALRTPKLPESLFQEVANGGQESTKTARDFASELLAQVAGTVIPEGVK